MAGADSQPDTDKWSVDISDDVVLTNLEFDG